MENLSDNILKKNTENINIEDVEIIPTNSRVVIKFYEKNPYRYVEKTDSGLILGIESSKTYHSNDTGEMEDYKELVACAKVIAVGNKCQNVKIDDDVFVNKAIALPLPFRKKGYYSLDENNIMCSIRKK